MAILKIARMGHPVLRQAARPVENPRAPEVVRLLADMEDTLADSGGIGLAAPQVHVPLRVLIYSVPESRTEDGRAVPLTPLINPEIAPLDNDPDGMSLGVEGCLSLPGMAGMVPRYSEISVSALTPAGEQIHFRASGYHARVIQHEFDHLEGILYPQRMADLSTFGYVEQFNKEVS